MAYRQTDMDYSLTERKYPLSSTIVPTISSPSLHLSFSTSLFGNISTHFPYCFPLCFHVLLKISFIEIVIHLILYKFSTQKYIYPLRILYMVTAMISKKEKKELEKLRKIRAYSILAKGETPEIVDTETYIIKSQSNQDIAYTVSHNGSWRCTCKDWEYHNLKHSTNIKCKHIHSVEMWLKLRDKLTEEPDFETDGLMEKSECVYCHSKNLKKDGMRRNKHGLKQRYKCKDCGKRFVIDKIKGYSSNSNIIALTMDLYFKGMSYRKITDILNQHYKLKLAHTTVMRWTHKFMGRINNYTEKLTPKLGDTWHCDEQMVKAKGKWFWNFNILDRESRFLITNNITEGRELLETKQVFRKAYKQYGQLPEEVYTDGLRAYPYAIKHGLARTVRHIRNVGLLDRKNNNRIERFHGTWRERDKIMRGMEDNEHTEELLDNFRTYYNFIRSHMGLEGKTPAEKVGLNLNLGRNKMLDLLERSVTPECTS